MVPGHRAEQYGVVAVLDALGMKGIIGKTDPGEVLKSWHDITEALANHVADANSQGYLVTLRIFSDTVIIAAGGGLQHPLFMMADLLLPAFCDALLEHSIYFRGSIAAGAFWESDSMILGPAIDEAAAWYEKSDWIGISATPSSLYDLDRLYRQNEVFSDLYVRWNVPLKKDVLPMPTWALAWPQYLVARNDNLGPAEVRALVEQLVLDRFSRSGPLDTVVSSKYHHTIVFLREVLGLPEPSSMNIQS